jgi:hypothetical protein
MPWRELVSHLDMNVLGVISLAIAGTGFAAVLIWAFTRSPAQIEADSRLWMDDEN